MCLQGGSGGRSFNLENDRECGRAAENQHRGGMRPLHRCVVVEMGGPFGTPITASRRLMVCEHRVVAWRMAAKDATCSPKTMFGADAATHQQGASLLIKRFVFGLRLGVRHLLGSLFLHAHSFDEVGDATSSST